MARRKKVEETPKTLTEIPEVMDGIEGKVVLPPTTTDTANEPVDATGAGIGDPVPDVPSGDGGDSGGAPVGDADTLTVDRVEFLKLMRACVTMRPNAYVGYAALVSFGKVLKTGSYTETKEFWERAKKELAAG